MSYEIGNAHDGGHDYAITVNGCLMTGWRRGSRTDVEAHVKSVDEKWTTRAGGRVVRFMKNGQPRTSHLRGARLGRGGKKATDVDDDLLDAAE